MLVRNFHAIKLSVPLSNKQNKNYDKIIYDTTQQKKNAMQKNTTKKYEILDYNTIQCNKKIYHIPPTKPINTIEPTSVTF